MKTLKTTGLPVDGAKKVTTLLNELLSDFQMLYMNLRGFHWNIKGNRFFMLHEKFEELYKETSETIDELAERILTLDAQPLHSYTDYISQSDIKAVTQVSDGDSAIDHLIDTFAILLKKERSLINIAADNNDEGTVALISELIGEQEKLLWMLKSYRNQ